MRPARSNCRGNCKWEISLGSENSYRIGRRHRQRRRIAGLWWLADSHCTPQLQEECARRIFCMAHVANHKAILLVIGCATLRPILDLVNAHYCWGNRALFPSIDRRTGRYSPSPQHIRAISTIFEQTVNCPTCWKHWMMPPNQN